MAVIWHCNLNLKQFIAIFCFIISFIHIGVMYVDLFCCNLVQLSTFSVSLCSIIVIFVWCCLTLYLCSVFCVGYSWLMMMWNKCLRGWLDLYAVATSQFNSIIALLHKMASLATDEGIELRPIPVKCIVSGPPSDIEEDVDCVSSEVTTALPRQMSRYARLTTHICQCLVWEHWNKS